MESVASAPKPSEPWDKGKLVGQKTPFKLKEIWAIRVHFTLSTSPSFHVLSKSGFSGP